MDIITQGIKYIGSKNKLIPFITSIVQSLDDVHTIYDGFAGTTRVGQAFRLLGYTVYSNDIADYSYAFGKCFIEASLDTIDTNELEETIHYLNNLDDEQEGILTRYYSGGSTSMKRGKLIKNDIMYWQRFNTLKADAIRTAIESYKEREHFYFALLTSLIIALDKVDNTVGVQQAFLKNSWAKRSFNHITLIPPIISLDRPIGRVYKSDTNAIAKKLQVDLAYYDPPYTSHNYSSYYHIWNTIVNNKIGDVSGIINRPVNIHKSDYNYKNKALAAFEDLLANTKSKYILISYNNEGIIPYNALISIARSFGHVETTEVDYKRNVMSQIGIYNTNGQIVGTPGSTKNKEYLILIKTNQ